MAAILDHLVVQMGPRCPSRGSDLANRSCLWDVLAFLDGNLTQVGIAGAVAIGVFNFY